MSLPAPGGSHRRSNLPSSEPHPDSLEVGFVTREGPALSVRHDANRGGHDGSDPGSRRGPRPPVYSSAFTPRQTEILALVADGLSNAEIASELGISRRTVEKHLEAIHMKAGTATRARLVAFASRERDAP